MEFSTKTEKYLFSRDQFRLKHQDEFLRKNVETNLLLVSTNELIISLTFFTSGKNLREIDNGLYKGDLIVSFCRIHFIISDLLLGGELVDAATLIRKQIELLGRLNELSNGIDIEKLSNKTPNVKNLKTGMRKIYSTYSEIAHSASPSIMQLIGSTEVEGRTYTTLYPEFQENSYAQFQHQTLCALEFYNWCLVFYLDNFPDYEPEPDAILFNIAFNQLKKIYPDSLLAVD